MNAEHLLKVLITGACLVACTAESAPEPEMEADPGVTRVDSAGVSLVQNDTPVWSPEAAWRVDPEPFLSIGVLEGPPEYQLFRAVDAVRTPDGRIIVANGGSQELRFFDGGGSFLYSAGAEGQGPEEFLGMSRIWLLERDSLLVYDYQNQRYVVLGLDGTFGRTVRLDVPGQGLAWPEDMLADSLILASSSLVDERAADAGPGVRRDSSVIRLFGFDGAVVDSLGVFAGSDVFVSTNRGSPVVASGQFGRDAQVAAHGDRWFYGSSDTYEIEVRKLDGSLLSIIRREVEERRMPPDFAARVRERQQGTFWEQIPLPEVLPFYERFKVDTEGNLWVLDYRLERDDPQVWSVFDAGGRWLGEVETPPGGRVTRFGADSVLGVWTDELDVEQVRIYRLEKPPAP